MANDKDEKLKKFLLEAEKKFGKGSIMKLSDGPTEVPVIPTGSLSLNKALGVGGFPTGRIVEIYGWESSTKTTLALSAIANAQALGHRCAFIDAEHALDPEWAAQLGINVDDLIVSQPESGEDALELCEAAVRSDSFKVIVVDSIAALVPKAEIEGEMGDAQIGLQARLMSKAMRKLTSAVSKSGVVLILINQLRHKVGILFGSPLTTSGGNAVKFYASQRLEVSRIETLTKGDTPLGIKVRVKVVKNKVAAPFTKCEYTIKFDRGFDNVAELLDYGVQYGVVSKSGTWYTFGETKLGQGRDNSVDTLNGDKALLASLEKQVLTQMFPKGMLVDTPDGPKRGVFGTSGFQAIEEDKAPKKQSKKPAKKDEEPMEEVR